MPGATLHGALPARIALVEVWRVRPGTCRKRAGAGQENLWLRLRTRTDAHQPRPVYCRCPVVELSRLPHVIQEIDRGPARAGRLGTYPPAVPGAESHHPVSRIAWRAFLSRARPTR
jgi:hypothetical protein